MTGDVSVANQRSIPGMVVPQCSPNVLVMESTYGNRQHADRSQQEASLVRRVSEVVESGGKVLIPAFAVGRAQEVILILARAIRRGEIPPFPVFVDGMVRSVNGVYAAFPDDLAQPIRRKVLKGDEDLFYDEWVGAVSVASDRERVLTGPPCCIVASSGMLIGGASSFYAERMAGDDRNLIAITGYQDEESPGRALLDLANKTDESRELLLSGTKTSVACRVETYSLSAHADAGELTALARRLSPTTAYLVHGDEAARTALASQVDAVVRDGVVLPENGGLMRSRRKRGAHGVTGV